MKIAIPTNGEKGLGEQISEHFGRSPTYTIVDDESDDVVVLPNTSEHMGGSGYPPEILGSAGVDVILCMGLGRRAIHKFNEQGIKVYIGASGTVEDILNQFRDNLLVAATEDLACKNHAFEGEHPKDGCGKKHH